MNFEDEIASLNLTKGELIGSIRLTLLRFFTPEEISKFFVDMIGYGYLRQDDDGHYYIIPDWLIDTWDEKSKALWDIKIDVDFAMDDFNNTFENYRLPGSTSNLKIIMENKNV